MRRFLLILLAVLTVLVVGLMVATRFYLRSDSVRQKVATRLESLYGGRVEVEDADIGVLGDSTLNGLRFYERGKTGEPPLITVGRVKTDVSALDLLRGVMPKEITLTDPTITLRLDSDGHFLTQLPENRKGEGPLPRIHVAGGQVTFQQEGRPEMVVKGINADMDPQGILSGTVKDDYWGEWSLLSGSFDRDTGVLNATLNTNQAEVTQDKLLRLPFVPAGVWREVEAQGITSVDFTFRHDPRASEGEQDHYRVDLDPNDATITLPTVALHTEKVRGRISVEDKLVTLDKVTGRALGGGLYVNGTLDFRVKESLLDLTVKATNLDVSKVPDKWDIPEALRKFGGQLNGQAHLKARLGEKVTTDGSTGDGKVTDMHIAGGTGEMDLRLEATPRGLRFSQPAGARKPGATGRLPAVAEPPTIPPELLATVILLQPPARESLSFGSDVTRVIADGARAGG